MTSVLPIAVEPSAEAHNSSDAIHFHCTPKEPAGKSKRREAHPTVVTYIDPTQGGENNLEPKHLRPHNNTWDYFARTLFTGAFQFTEDTIDGANVLTYSPAKQTDGSDVLQDTFVEVFMDGHLFGFGDTQIPAINSITRNVKELHSIHHKEEASHELSGKYTLDTVNDIQIDNENAWEFYSWSQMYYDTASTYISYGKNGAQTPVNKKLFPSNPQDTDMYKERDQLGAVNIVLRFGGGNNMSMFQGACNDDPTKKITVYDGIVFCILRQEQMLSSQDNNPAPPSNHAFNYDRYRMTTVLFAVLADERLRDVIRTRCMTAGGYAAPNGTGEGSNITIKTLNDYVIGKYAKLEATNPNEFPKPIPITMFDTGVEGGLLRVQFFDNMMGMLGNVTKFRLSTYRGYDLKKSDFHVAPNQTIETFYNDLEANGVMEQAAFFSTSSGVLTMRVAGLLPISRAFLYGWFAMRQNPKFKNDRFCGYKDYKGHSMGTYQNYFDADHKLFTESTPSPPKPEPEPPKGDDDESNSGIAILILIGLVAGYALTRKRKA